MPMPKPKKGESKDDFLERCMGNDTMNDEFPDNDQRYAVCNDLWRDKKKKEAMMGKGMRSLPIQTEWRVTRNEGEPVKISGHAAVFDQLSDPIMGFREKIAKGAFKKSIRRKDDVRALWNHNSDYVLGRTKSGTLKVKEDDVGLAIEIQPPDTTWANDLITTMERGDVDQMSFAFAVVKDE